MVPSFRMKRYRLTAVVPALLFAVLCTTAASAAGTVKGPRIAMVIAPRDFTDQEYADPRSVFDKAGATVRVASTTRGTATGHDGANVQVDLSFNELSPDQFDALVTVGGTGALTYLMDNEALRNLIVAASRSGKVVGAICVGPAVLARAGVLRNRLATCYPDKRVISILKMSGADYSERSVVSTGRFITANGPAAARDFALSVLEAIRKG